MNLVPTPELDKMLGVRDRSQPIGEFIEWLRDNEHVHLMVWPDEVDDTDDYYAQGAWEPYTPTIEGMLAKFFGIDLNKCEQERRAVLEAMREASEGVRS